MKNGHAESNRAKRQKGPESLTAGSSHTSPGTDIDLFREKIKYLYSLIRRCPGFVVCSPKHFYLMKITELESRAVRVLCQHFAVESSSALLHLVLLSSGHMEGFPFPAALGLGNVM